MKVRSALPVVINFSCILWLVGNQFNEFNEYDLLYLGGVGFCISIAQFLFLEIISRRLSERYSGALIAIFCALNFYFFLGLAIQSNLYVIYTLTVLVGLSIYLLNKNYLKAIVVFAMIFTLLALMEITSKFYLALDDNSSSPKKSELYESNYSKSVKQASIKPNIYVLVFDALVSEKAYSEFYGKNTLPWNNFLRKNNFAVYQDAISPNDNTVSSFVVLLSMHQEYPVDGDWKKFLSGKYLNPTFESFKNQGYKIQFINKSNFFGLKGGGYLDFITDSSKIKMCEFLGVDYGWIACRPNLIGLLSKYINFYLDDESFLEYFINRIGITSKEQTPWLTIAYLMLPGHTPTKAPTYQYHDELARSSWLKEFPSRVAAATLSIERLVSKIRLDDPKAIIFVLGDHGSYFLRGVTLPKLASGEVNDALKSTITLDKTGISFAVFPSKFCTSQFQDGYWVGSLFVNTLDCLKIPKYEEKPALIKVFK